MGVVFLILGLVAFGVSVFFAYKNRHNTTKLIASITLGIFFATFLIVFPTKWVSEGTVVENSILYAILSSLLFSFKTLSGGQNIAQLETMDLSGVLKTIYIGFSYIMFALAPILASSLILSFVGDTGERIRYFFSHSKKCYVFSEINENSIALAKGLKNAPGKKTLVFCNSKKADKELYSDAKQLGAITLYKACSELSLLPNFKKYEFCFLSDDEDNNLELTKDIIAKSKKFENHKITVNTFAKSGANVAVLESLMEQPPCLAFESPKKRFIKQAKDAIENNKKVKIIFFNARKADKDFIAFAKKQGFTLFKKGWEYAKAKNEFRAYNIILHYIAGRKTETMNLKISNNRFVNAWEDSPLKVRFIDEISLFCNNLLFEKPLFRLSDQRKEISALLIGCGRLGMSMLKTIVWCGQIEDYTLKIRVVDKDAEKLEEELYAQAPELKRNYDIKFVKADIESSDFESAIQKFSDATFVCVATGSDDLNIATAERVYRIFRRNYTGYLPPIYTRVRKDIKSNTLSSTNSFLDKRNIEVFGTTDSIFSNNRLFHSRLENLALAVHLCYNNVLSESRDSFKYKKALNEFYTSEYSRRSSMAVALHIPAKLHTLGITANTIDRSEPFVSEKELRRYERIIKDAACLERLAQQEHERWNAFVRSEGFRSATIEAMKIYAPLTRSNKDEMARLHPCIVSWDNLAGLQTEYDALREKLNLKENNFQNNDREIIRKIPEIIRKANQLCEEDQ